MTAKKTADGGGTATSPAAVFQDVTARDLVVESITAGLAVRSATTVNVYFAQTAVAAEPAPAPAAEPGRGPNPYKGLRYFDERDAEHFFGRKGLIDERLWPRFLELCVPRPGATGLRLLPVLGPSGSGKSSLVRAGLIPELARRPTRPYGRPRVAVLTPGARPLEALARVLARIVVTGDPTPEAKTREFAAELALANSRDQYDALRRIADGLPDIEATRLLVVVDQFEEAYATPAAEDERQAFEHARDAFVANLIHAARDVSGHVSVVLAMRDDFFGATARHDELHQHLARHGLLVPAMSREELEAAIREPAARAGHPLPEGVIQLLVEQSLGREGALPLLQVALQQIWDAFPQDPAETLRKLGGVGGALARTADQMFAALSAEEQRIARRAFLAMVNLGEGAADTRRRVALDEIVAATEQAEDVRRVLERFSRWDVRLVTLSREPSGTVTAEVTHEALISEWGRLRDDWLAEGRQDVRFARRIAEAARAWEAGTGGLWRPPELDLLRRYAERHVHDLTQLQREFLEASLATYQDEQDKQAQRRRALKVVAGVAAVLALIAGALSLGLSVVAWQARVAADEANRQRQIATARASGIQALWLSENGHSDHLAERGAALARESWRLFRTPEAHAAADALVKSLPIARIVQDEWVSSVEFDSEGRLLAVASGANSGKVVVIAPNTGEELHRIEHDKFASDVAFDPKGRWLATASGDVYGGSTRIIDLEAGHDLHRLEHDGMVEDVIFSPEGGLLVSAITTITRDGIVQAIDPKTGQELYSIDYEKEPFRTMAFDRRGRWVAIGTGPDFSDYVGKERGSAAVIDAETGQELYRARFERPVEAVAFDPSGRWLAAGSRDGGVRVIEHETGQERYRIEHDGWVTGVAFDPKGRWLATASTDNSARVIDLESGQELYRIRHGAQVEAVAFDPEGRWLATASLDGSARVIEPETGQELYRIEHGGRVGDLTFDPKGRWLATRSGEGQGSARVMALQAGQEFRRIEHGEPVHAVAFDPKGRWLATASGASLSGNVRVVGLDNGQGVRQFEHDFEVRALAFDSEGRWLATGVNPRSLASGLGQVIDVESGETLYIILPAAALAFGPEGRWLAAAAFGNELVLTDATTDDELYRIKHDQPIHDLAFDVQGRWLATASGEYEIGSARVFDPVTGQELYRIEEGRPVNAVAFDPQGRWLMIASGDCWEDAHELFDCNLEKGGSGSLRSIDPMTGKELYQIEHAKPVHALAIDADGRWLATGSGDVDGGSARVFDLATGQELHRIEHGGLVHAVTFDPESRWLATASGRSAAVIDLETGQELYRIEHGGRVNAVAFDPQGRWLGTASHDGSARLIHADPNYAVDLLCARAGRNLSRSEWQIYLPGEPYRRTCDTWRVPEEMATGDSALASR